MGNKHWPSIYPEPKLYTFSNPHKSTEEEQTLELSSLPQAALLENVVYTEIMKIVSDSKAHVLSTKLSIETVLFIYLGHAASIQLI